MDSELNLLSPPATPPLDFNKVRTNERKKKKKNKNKLLHIESTDLHARHTYLAAANEMLLYFRKCVRK